ncbi:hypothetical protein [Tabrizicola sp. BL-A-41-H6]|uniref:hypothetical protein n=1 Tax=Tabrizicola sp. BL-A-41-H6 TaxID=3421107 RepID=UPI003D66F731
MKRALVAFALVLIAVPAAAFFHSTAPDDAEMARLFAAPLPAPEGPLSVYHLGHSLVNRDMPAMLAQLAGEGHSYDSQLGWGTTLKAHWGDEPINGFEAENNHDRFRPAHDAVASGDYDAIVLTEMVEIRDAIAYFDSPEYLALWANAALEARPDVRLYLYETWHPLNDPGGWITRLETDFARYWEAEILRPALAELPEGAVIHVIPAGQALAALVEAVEAQGGVGNLRDRNDLFALQPDGSRDMIHLNDLGNYFVALVHYAVLYQKDPTGLPFELTRADGSVATSPAPKAARLMQEIAWQAARSTPLTGVAR